MVAIFSIVICYLTLDFLKEDSAVYERAAVYWCLWYILVSQNSTAFLFSTLNLKRREGKSLSWLFYKFLFLFLHVRNKLLETGVILE